jgi:hypothetical protein
VRPCRSSIVTCRRPRSIKPARSNSRATFVMVGAISALVVESALVIMGKPDEFFGQVGDNPLSAAIGTRRNALDEGSHLSDLHVTFNLQTNTNACSAAKFSCSSMRLN